jgi:GR25 family glycosyltransferase involved in LPS biosynthesis
MSIVQYYCISDKNTENILFELNQTSVKLENVKFIDFPLEITHDLKRDIFGKGIYFKGQYMDAKNLSESEIRKILKHYLAVKDFVQSGSSYGVFFEDTIGFKDDLSENVANFVNELNKVDSNWDVFFDSPELYYMDSITTVDRNVYLKSNIPSSRRDGSCRRTHFYIMTSKYAEKLLKNFLPISTNLETHYNYTFDKTHACVYWSSKTKIQSWSSNKKPQIVWVDEKLSQKHCDYVPWNGSN